MGTAGGTVSGATMGECEMLVGLVGEDAGGEESVVLCVELADARRMFWTSLRQPRRDESVAEPCAESVLEDDDLPIHAGRIAHTFDTMLDDPVMVECEAEEFVSVNATAAASGPDISKASSRRAP